MRKIKISEQQDRYIQHILSESGLNPNANTGEVTIGDTHNSETVPQSGNQLTNNVEKIKTNAKRQGVPQNVVDTGLINAGDTTKGDEILINQKQTNESILITKKQLDEVKLKNMKNGSQVIKVKNFLR